MEHFRNKDFKILLFLHIFISVQRYEKPKGKIDKIKVQPKNDINTSKPDKGDKNIQESRDTKIRCSSFQKGAKSNWCSTRFTHRIS